MKRTIKVFLALAAFILAAVNLNAQSTTSDYKLGIGARLGGLTSGLTVKGFTDPTTALEGILSWGYRATLITGLYEKHNYINSAPGLTWYYGGGGHLGFFRYGAHYHYYVYRGDRVYVVGENETAVVGGLDFILGLDYKFNGAPFNVALDIKPFIDFYHSPSGYFDGALSLRFAF